MACGVGTFIGCSAARNGGVPPTKLDVRPAYRLNPGMFTTVFGILCAIFGGLIIVVHSALYLGLILAGIRARAVAGSKPTVALTVTVAVPARDEEALLPELLRTLEDQTSQAFNVRLIDDRSTDRTPHIVSEFAAQHPDRVSVTTLTEDPRVDNPKLNALIEGTRDLTTDLVLFTDADCRVPPTWVEEVVRCFADPRVGLVIAPIETRRVGTVLSLYHAYEHVFKAAYNAGCTGIGLPTGGFGNNLAVRSAVLEEIGGYESVDSTATEDAALIARVRAKTTSKVLAVFSRGATVITEPQRSWRDLTNQEVRWHTGGIFSTDFQSRLGYRFLMFFLLASVAFLPFGLLHWLFAVPAAVSFTTMTLMAVIGGLLTRQPVRKYWLPLVAFVLGSMLYNSFLTTLTVLRPRLTWKGSDMGGVR